MNNEEKLNKALDELHKSFEHSLPRQSGQVIRAMNRSRLTIADVLSKHADSGGVIPKSKANAVVSDLATVEGELYRNIRDELHAVVYDTAESTTVGVAEAVIAVLGALTIVEFAGLSTAIAGIGAGLVALVFTALTGDGYIDYAQSVEESVFNRKGDDDKVLNDRLKELARSVYGDITVTLRNSIQQGEGTSGMIRKIERKFKDVAWRIKTIVETEVAYAQRQSIGRFAEKTGIARGLKIVDYPHGDPATHRRHKCYEYAHQNEHGLGQGVYPVTTRKIRNPHPRCRSSLHFVLVDELK